MDRMVEFFDWIDNKPVVVWTILAFINIILATYYYYKMKHYKNKYEEWNEEVNYICEEIPKLKTELLNLKGNEEFLIKLNDGKNKLLEIQNEKIAIIEKLLKEKDNGSDISS